MNMLTVADAPPLVKFESKINLPCVGPQGLVSLAADGLRGSVTIPFLPSAYALG